MSFTGPAGFYNAPVTKLLVVIIGTLSTLGSILKWKPYFHLQLVPHITIHHQFWRLLTCQIAFTSSGDVFFGTMIIYAMRIIERYFGSSKYAAFIFVIINISTLLEVGALVTGIKFGLRYIPGGPYALLFAMLYQYHRLVPVLYRFRIFGITFNNKSFLYMLSLQIFISQGVNTIIPCICGLLSGALYRSNISNIKQWRFPSKLQSISLKYLQPVLATPPIPRTNHALPIQRPITAMSSALDVESLVASATGTNNTNNNNDNDNESSITRRRQSLNDDDDDNDDITSIHSHSTNSIITSRSIHSISPSSPLSPTSTTSLLEPQQQQRGGRIDRSTTSTNSVRDYIDALTGRAPLTQNEIQPPSQRHLTVLTTMFPNHSRESITDALSASHNNINRAVEIMLHTPVPNQDNYH
ncbi:hypothetical protein BJ944DRAFT_263446 [Cunninghamella echinulata]|nr:hypothetical protein BJ944DRAFT_263446 [Cunninghamella echinulata]